ncbi:uncharacterized protein MONOS_13307 [Monocercomonoides exilis]|uniref:uncharacterized protein n=1 Tax=Monocercomonoides exilis TaxID=2049356 RepID=UPI003559AE76|nr:hypothetical protein MONOS_13307 [Monocercomonoides exilis]|eukprot:MONOS_13307.1-p1 / transcript=MONOS_13307.1 / gene=MONOS_13307 / organism=Monocercomonoides_exilis_PA203 / gene_product=unspecified product / transcript_product=unspecified product / location=Mono_scaffold00806:19800-20444(+) / protein_length=177 / sequence_SO=supercontig / SO=protein_coding / is_pseudo=false
MLRVSKLISGKRANGVCFIADRKRENFLRQAMLTWGLMKNSYFCGIFFDGLLCGMFWDTAACLSQWSLRNVLFLSRELSEEDVIEVYFFAYMAIFEGDKAWSRRLLEVAGGMEEKGLNGFLSIDPFIVMKLHEHFFAEMLKEIILLELDLRKVWEEDWLEKAFKKKEERLNRPFVC